MDDQARISISLYEGKLEISGSESFVREQLENFRDLIHAKLSAIPTRPSGPVLTKTGLPADDNPYPNVIAFDGDEIKVLKPAPGKRGADKMVYLNLLYLLAKSLKGEDSASFDELREVCREHACLDSANFASAMKRKGSRSYFILSGTGKKQVAKLTHPGRTAADELAKELNEQ